MRPRPRRRRRASTGVRRRRAPGARARWAAWWAVFVFSVLGLVMIYETYVSLVVRPRVYDRLAAHGIRETADFGYTPGVRSDGYYTLYYDFNGVPRSARYQHNFPQFRSLRRGERIDVVVDPDNGDTVYTARDVRERTNSGFGALAAFTIAGTILSFGFAYYMLRFTRPP